MVRADERPAVEVTTVLVVVDSAVVLGAALVLGAAVVVGAAVLAAASSADDADAVDESLTDDVDAPAVDAAAEAVTSVVWACTPSTAASPNAEAVARTAAARRERAAGCRRVRRRRVGVGCSVMTRTVRSEVESRVRQR